MNRRVALLVFPSLGAVAPGIAAALLTAAFCASDERPVVAAEEPLREVRLGSLQLQVPAHWKQQQPKTNLRLGQFEIPAAEGDPEPGELTVFNFGGGNSVQANVDRWIAQFDAAERTSKVTQGRCPQGEYVLVDVSGTFQKPIGPPIQQRTQPAPGYRMLGIILATEKDGYYFLKLVGPQKTVLAEPAKLRAAIGGLDKDEKPYEPKQP